MEADAEVVGKKYSSVSEMVHATQSKAFAAKFDRSLPLHRFQINIASEIDKAMKEKNISVRELAKTLKVRKRRVKNYLRGNKLTIEIISDICVALKYEPKIRLE